MGASWKGPCRLARGTGDSGTQLEESLAFPFSAQTWHPYRASLTSNANIDDDPNSDYNHPPCFATPPLAKSITPLFTYRGMRCPTHAVE